MNDTLKKLRIVLQVQTTLFRLATRRAVTSGVLVALALVFALSAIAIFNLAGFDALEQRLGAVTAGLIVGATDLGLCLLLLRLATGETKESEEERLAREITEMTLTSLSQDLDEARDELREFAGEIHRLGASVGLVTNVVSGPLSLALKVLGAQAYQHSTRHKKREAAPTE